MAPWLQTRHKWSLHKGFRQTLILHSHFCINHSLSQVTVLKLQIKYEDAGGLVPWEIHIYFITEEGEESDTYKVSCTQKLSDVKTMTLSIFWCQVVPVSDNSASVEFTVSNEEHIQMRLYRKGQLERFYLKLYCTVDIWLYVIIFCLHSKERSGQDHLTAPVVTIKPEPTSSVTLGEWHAVSPLIK